MLPPMHQLRAQLHCGSFKASIRRDISRAVTYCQCRSQSLWWPQSHMPQSHSVVGSGTHMLPCHVAHEHGSSVLSTCVVD